MELTQPRVPPRFQNRLETRLQRSSEASNGLCDPQADGRGRIAERVQPYHIGTMPPYEPASHADLYTWLRTKGPKNEFAQLVADELRSGAKDGAAPVSYSPSQFVRR